MVLIKILSVYYCEHKFKERKSYKKVCEEKEVFEKKL